MASNKKSVYFGWSVPKLKLELVNRGASTKGKKEELIMRLEAYDRNQNFEEEPVLLPPPLDPDWPTSGFQQLRQEHKIHLPKLTAEQIDIYFKYRQAVDTQLSGEVKAIKKGKDLEKGQKVHACSISVQSPNIYLTGIVGAMYKGALTYWFKLKLHKSTGEVLNSHCECPGGKGPHGTCKHIAAVLQMLSNFISGNELDVESSCTEVLQTFHKPKKQHTGSPIKADNMKTITRDCKLDDPRPEAFRNLPGYEDHVRNTIINYCSNTSKNISMRFLWGKADAQSASQDHDYLKLSLNEQIVDNALVVTEEHAQRIEQTTRRQAKSVIWREQRLWRITASRFGEITKITSRRNMQKLCQTFTVTRNICTKATLHGQQYEKTAIKKFEKDYGRKVLTPGLIIYVSKPFLAATPDGIVDEKTIIEVKCPYAGRDAMIKPGKHFPFLEYDEAGNIVLKQHSNYYMQVQGQLLISKRRFCYFIVYTFTDFHVQKIPIDDEYCQYSLLPKLELFYEKYLRKYIAQSL